MSLTKAVLFNTGQIRVAELAKAISHPARIAILEFLAKHETCICGDITEELPLAQSTVSQHLKALKKAGIIKGTIDGVRTCYCLNEDVVDEMKCLTDVLMQELAKPTQSDYC